MDGKDQSKSKRCKMEAWKRAKWKGLAAFLLAFSIVVSEFPAMAFAGADRAASPLPGAGIAGQGNLSYPAENLIYPTGDMIYDEREISAEEIPDDIPIYGNTSFFSLAREVSEETYEEDLDAPKSRYGYTHLPEKFQGFYDACWKAILDFRKGPYNNADYSETKDTHVISGVNFQEFGLTVKEAGAVYYSIRDDFPEFFWLYPGYSSDNTVLYILLSKDYYTKEAREKDEKAFIDGQKRYIQAAIEEEDLYERVRLIHDMLINDIEYAKKSNGQPEDALWAHSVIGVFGERKSAVCEGYAKAFQLLCNICFIENVYITGTGNGQSHAWNAVKIDDEWYCVDVTWDDAGAGNGGDGLLYLYFCIPATVFHKTHKADNIYTLPTMSNSNKCTFYYKYDCDFTQIASKEAAEKQLNGAGSLVPGQYIHALVNSNTAGYVAAASGLTSYSYIESPDGNWVIIIDATKFKVKYPAVSIDILRDAEFTIDRDVSNTEILRVELIAKDNANPCDDVLRWSSSDSCVVITQNPDGKSVTLRGRRNGTAIITITAVVGNITKTCTVTVVGESEPEEDDPEFKNIYVDAAATKEPTEEDFMVWVNGGNVKMDGGQKYNYKVRSLYTNIKASDIVTTVKGKTKTKKGKLVAGITLSPEQPTLEKGKIVDKEAAAYAKASVNAKTGLVKVTAQKKAGEVYLWIMDTGDKKSVAYAKITVTAAPKKILVNDKEHTIQDREVVKKQTLAFGEDMEVYLEPLLESKGTELAPGGTFSVSYSKNGENYVSVTPIAGSRYGYQITPLALDTAKAGKTLNVKVNFVCNENNKKVSVAITIQNPVENISFSAGSGLTMVGERDFTVKYSETQAQTLTLNFDAQPANPSFATTDKPKVLAVTGESGIQIDEKGRVKVTKPSGDAAKIKSSLGRDGKSIVVKVPKKLAVGTETHFVLYYNEDCYELYSVKIVE